LDKKFKEKAMSNAKTMSRSARRMASSLSMKVSGLDDDEAALRLLDDSLNKALLDTFPASDPVSSLRFD
jgi:hypothetical protein